MCGIAGILGLRDGERIKQMTDAMIHRGPDDEGFHLDEQVSLGMRRLSIIDVAGGHQPIYNEDRTKVIVYNGEVYNYQGLKEILEEKGHIFRTNSDTETILHAYEQYGKECVHKFNGMFAFAIWDSQKRELFMARDRLGIKPVFYAQRNGRFLFGSEVKVLLASGLIEKELDEIAVGNFVSLYNLPFPQTMFRGVYQLRPGHRLTIRLGEEPKIEEWWDVRFAPAEKKRNADVRELQKELRQLLEAAIERRLISEVPLGAFLSGGIDSSIVVGLMSRMMDQPVKTFSVGFHSADQKYDERSFAKIVAEKYQTDHTEVLVNGKDVVNNLSKLIRAMDLPSGDAIQTFFISEAARRRVTVSLSGLGGDELFAGYQQFRFIPEAQDFQRAWRSRSGVIRSIGKALAAITPNDVKSRMKYRLLLDVLQHESSFERQYDIARSVFHGSEKGEVLSDDFQKRIEGASKNNPDAFPQDSLDVVRQYVPQIAQLDLIDAMSYLELKTYMPHMLLRDTDTMSMANSLEIRVPLIDYTVVEFVAQHIPSDLKRKDGMAKHLLIQSCRDILPDEVIFRKKRGFEFPMPNWLRGELRPIVEDCLSKGSIEKRGIFRYVEIEKLKKRFFSIRPRVPYLKIWIPVVLELWCREYLDD